MRGAGAADSPLRVLAVIQDLWGERIAANIAANAPPSWSVETWVAPRVLPPIIDDPEDFLPDELPQADLVLALGEKAPLVQLIPDIARMSGARAVIAPIDRNEALPPGLAKQLQGWLGSMDVALVMPKPFCSLTETSYNRTPLVEHYDDARIRRFARRFGKPEFSVTVEQGTIVGVEVRRHSACGCAHHVAKNLAGVAVADALEKAGLLHHHFPCLADMQKDAVYRDTLMHVSGNFLKDALRDEMREELSQLYIKPLGLVKEEDQTAEDRKSTRLNSSHTDISRMPSSA